MSALAEHSSTRFGPACVWISLGVTVQTFLPYLSFAESAAVLDRSRLGKQRIEALQLLPFAPEVDELGQDDLELPPWIGDEAFHLSHRSNLLRKNPEFYGAVFPAVPADLPYIWPGETIRHDG